MSYYYLQTSNDHLAHHGILGMKWGIRRYQPYAKGSKGGKEIGLAAKKSKGSSLRERRAKKQMAKQQAEILRRARAAKDNKEKQAQVIEEIKKRPTATTVLEVVDQLSTQDLISLNDRIKAIRNLEMAAKMEKDTTFNAIDSAMNKVKKIQGWGKTGIDSYKTANDLLSILDGTFKQKEGSKKDSSSK